MSPNDPYAAPEKEFIRRAFDSISPRYDLLNRIMSFGQADRWRQKACEIVLYALHSGHLPEEEERGALSILDLGCGTGKFLECFLKARPWRQAIGIDLSPEMIKKARAEVPGNVIWLQQDFDVLPFPESSFDLVISAFTLRSVQNLHRFFFEVHKVLVPGGWVGFLELTRPIKLWQRVLFFPYLRIFLPVVGRLISGNGAAYQFLAHSVENFPEPEQTLSMMRGAGFTDFRTKSFSFGTATLIIAKK